MFNMCSSARMFPGLKWLCSVVMSRNRILKQCWKDKVVTLFWGSHRIYCFADVSHAGGSFNKCSITFVRNKRPHLLLLINNQVIRNQKRKCNKWGNSRVKLFNLRGNLFLNDNLSIFLNLCMDILYNWKCRNYESLSLFLPFCTTWNIRSSPPEVFLRKCILEIWSKFIREHPCRSAICNIIEIAHRHECSPVNLLYIFRTRFSKDTSGGLFLKYARIRFFSDLYTIIPWRTEPVCWHILHSAKLQHSSYLFQVPLWFRES